MPSKFKNMVRERRAKTGESWEAAARHVRAQDPRRTTGASHEDVEHMEVDVLRSYYAPSYGEINRDGTVINHGITTFSVLCKQCNGWIHAGEAPHEGTCFCGKKYEVIFVSEEDPSLPSGPCCIDCGTPFASVHTNVDRNPWEYVNEWQMRCHPCHEARRARLSRDQRVARDGHVLVLHSGELGPIERPGEIRCALCPPGPGQPAYLVEINRNGKTILLTSEDPGAARFNGPIKTLSECNAGDEVYASDAVTVSGPVRWFRMKIVHVGAADTRVITLRTLEAALKQCQIWMPGLSDVHMVKKHLLGVFALEGSPAQIELVNMIVRKATIGRVPSVALLIEQLRRMQASGSSAGVRPT